jgi:hypothetical protein
MELQCPLIIDLKLNRDTLVESKKRPELWVTVILYRSKADVSFVIWEVDTRLSPAWPPTHFEPTSSQMARMSEDSDCGYLQEW